MARKELEQEILAEVEINGNKKIVVSMLEGEDDLALFDVRVHVKSEKYSGPTKKGIALSPKDWKKILPIITKALKTV